MSSTFFMPPVNIIGENALADAVATLRGYGFKKGLIVTDKFLATSGMADETSQ